MNYANHYGYSDVNPYEVVGHVSEKTIEVRAMNAERDPEWSPEIIPGGFSGHCVNQQSQKWIIKSDPKGPIVRIRLRKNGRWYDKYGNEFGLSDRPVKHHDYNF